MLNYRFKYAGWSLVVVALVFTVLYFGFNFRFQLSVLAIYSSFFETKFFTVIRTNFADELIVLLYITGFAMVVLSRDKTECAEVVKIRHTAMQYAFISNTALQLIVVLFVYGQGFIGFLVINLITLPLIYTIVFGMLKRRATYSRNSS